MNRRLTNFTTTTKPTNHDIAATARGQPDEMSTHSTDNRNIIAEDGIVTSQHGRERSAIDAIDGLTIEQYLRAIADNIGGINIK
jgi:hypothetical protein